MVYKAVIPYHIDFYPDVSTTQRSHNLQDRTAQVEQGQAQQVQLIAWLAAQEIERHA